MIPRKIVAIMACDPQGVIGKKGALPWYYPEELAHFCRTTQGQTLIMGRKTFEGLPVGFFNNRRGIIFSKTKPSYLLQNSNRLIFLSSLDNFNSLNGLLGCQLFMIGGAQIAHLFLEKGLISTFILTKIHKSFEGDSFLNLKWVDHWPVSSFEVFDFYTIYKLTNPYPSQQ